MAAPAPAAVVVMGVSGAGKTTIGRLLAERLGPPWRFVDGDDLHPPRNVARMRAGQPLDDADRAPWLDRVRAVIAGARAGGAPVVIACSALKRAYRDRIGAGAPDVRLVWLHGDPQLIRSRLEARRGHFMTAAMLDSQLATLEPPGKDEAAVAVDVAGPPGQAVAAALARL
ncbi:gluconokinase [Camelimonas abortus]|uniref:Gluconokinase n=1 Tax=Camelimonas abortus TaxID=1017184 RepID=A0ABV7LHD5_9HYPH